MVLKQVILKKGRVSVEEQAVPLPRPNEVLVRVAFSLVSTGTELRSIEARKKPVMQALKEKALVEKFKELIRKRGFLEAVRIAQTRISAPVALGYSNSGIVVEVGEGVRDIKPGDRVACAGAGYATHSSYALVPKNLVAKVPREVSLEDAAFATVGAIALQGVRRAKPTLGERFVVMGLGLIGVIAAQLLKANGVRVLSTDVSGKKVALAKSLGLEAVDSSKASVEQVVKQFAGLQGADAVLITASTPSNDLINQAMKLARKKGRVIIVGDVGLNLEREEFYKKELDVLISTSYGPGRYDREYEEKGVDYPLSYVRWTAQRNMQAFLEMLSEGKVEVGKLVDTVYDVEDAPEAYEKLARKELGVVVFKYAREPVVRKVEVSGARGSVKGKIKVGLIGPGKFATSTLLPALRRIPDYFLHAVAGRQSHEAKNVATSYGAAYFSTDAAELVEDEKIDLIVIATPHNLHGPLVIQALQKGKHIFVEKPLTIKEGELRKIEGMVKSLKRQVLMVGHNRRYAPFAAQLKAEFPAPPRVMLYRVNAGFVPSEHWTQDLEIGGGRILGEGVHFFDFFNYLSDSAPAKVSASSIGTDVMQGVVDDNISATVEFENGDLATLVYASLGGPGMDKEHFEIFAGGKSAALKDFFELSVFDHKRKTWSGKQNKGHFNELLKLAQAIQGKYDASADLEDAILAMQTAFEVKKKITGL